MVEARQRNEQEGLVGRLALKRVARRVPACPRPGGVRVADELDTVVIDVEEYRAST